PAPLPLPHNPIDVVASYYNRIFLPPTTLHNPPLPTVASPPLSWPHSLPSHVDANPIILETLPSTSVASSHDVDHPHLPSIDIYLRCFQPQPLITLICRLQTIQLCHQPFPPSDTAPSYVASVRLPAAPLTLLPSRVDASPSEISDATNAPSYYLLLLPSFTFAPTLLVVINSSRAPSSSSVPTQPSVMLLLTTTTVVASRSFLPTTMPSTSTAPNPSRD
ncbi:hypothetical protein BHE74_00058767, partial [Ensete ventricosum]